MNNINQWLDPKCNGWRWKNFQLKLTYTNSHFLQLRLTFIFFEIHCTLLISYNFFQINNTFMR